MDFPFDLSKLDMSSIMEMANQMKEKMQQAEAELARLEVEAVVGGGMVKVKANGKGDIISIQLDPELIAMNDKQMMENLLASGVNQALADARKLREEQLQKMTGFGLPGWFA